MDVAKQRIKAEAARKKEERLTKGAEVGDSSAPKTVSKTTKRKVDGKGSHPSKKTVTIPGDTSPKGKSALKPSHSAGKGAMTPSGPVSEGPSCLLTHKAYAVAEVGSFVKSMDIEPCDLVGTEELGESALFDITRVRLFSTSLVWFYPLFCSTNVCVLLLVKPWFTSRLSKSVALPRR